MLTVLCDPMCLHPNFTYSTYHGLRPVGECNQEKAPFSMIVKLREGLFPALTEDGRFSLETASNATNTVSTLRISNLDFRERAPRLNQTAVERVESALVISHKLFLFLRSLACEVMENMFIN